MAVRDSSVPAHRFCRGAARRGAASDAALRACEQLSVGAYNINAVGLHGELVLASQTEYSAILLELVQTSVYFRECLRALQSLHFTIIQLLLHHNHCFTCRSHRVGIGSFPAFAGFWPVLLPLALLRLSGDLITDTGRRVPVHIKIRVMESPFDTLPESRHMMHPGLCGDYDQ